MDYLLNEIRHDAIEKMRMSLPVSDAEQGLLETATGRVLDAEMTARKEGLLALEEMAYEMNRQMVLDALCYDALMMLADGVDPGTRLEVLSNRYWSDAPAGCLAMAEYLFIRGIGMVQEGESPVLIKMILGSLLPREIFETIMENYEKDRERREQEVDENAMRFFETEPERNEELPLVMIMKKLEKTFSTMTAAQIQEVLRETDNTDVIMTLLGLSHAVRETICVNMSTRLQKLVIEECYALRGAQDQEVFESAKRIIEVIEKLQDAED